MISTGQVIEQPYVQVALALPLTRLFTYQVPAGLRLMVGHAVRVPFGKRKLSGYVIEGVSNPEVPGIRPVICLLDDEPVIDSARIQFCRWAADYYLAGLGEMIATALPSTYRAKSRRLYFPTQAGIERVSDGKDTDGEECQLIREVILSPGRTSSGLARRLHGELGPERIPKLLSSLLRKELILAEDVVSGRKSGRVPTVSLVPGRSGDPAPRGARMRSILEHLRAHGGQMDTADLVQLEGSSVYASLRRLVDQGRIERGERENRQAVAQGKFSESTRPVLNPEQEAAVAKILARETGATLLCGVTGSGKTEVYLHAAESILAAGRQVLVLVPEIALTPQLTERFFARFKDRIAVLHSALTSAERLREWRRIRAGDAHIAIGARSALFAPFTQLGLIVVDEEHDDSYKQDDGVRYHARDLAVLRARLDNCPIVLGSATPSMESWWNARHGRYQRIDLSQRATPAPLPEIQLIDTRGQSSRDLLHERTRTMLERALGGGGKAIVLYNRRGYAPVVECAGCGAHFQCPSCGIGMVLHRKQRQLICHHCGLHRRFQPDCTACGSPFEVLGHGTERVEEILALEFPGVTLFRMDADTTTRRGSHAEILDRFRHASSGILVGTQLVAKGHDFPDVQAAAVLGVDHILNMPDFRSAERTFALVTQLAGRAGRSATGGMVAVQTRHPDHFVFRMLKQAQGVEALDAFMEAGARLRQALGHPPTSRLVLVKIEGTRRDKTFERAASLAQGLRKAASEARVDVGILGPVPAPLARLVGRWRYQIVIRGPRSAEFRGWISAQQSRLERAHGRGARVAVDVDPRSLL